MPARAGHLYFPIASAFLLALTLVGFSDNLVTNVGQPSNSNPKFIIHGLFCLAWMVLLVVQANLVRIRNVALHRRLGVAGMVIAVGVTLSTLCVFAANWPGWGGLDQEAKSNRLFLPAYAVFVVLAWRARWKADRHKRYILLASFFMLGPVIARTFDPLIVPFTEGIPVETVDSWFPPYFFGIWIAFFLSLIIYDRVMTGRVHPISVAGLALFCVIEAISFLT